MRQELRGAERFPEFGRVDCEQISALPGVLEDISNSGCKVHFPFPATVDQENEYSLKIQFSRQDFSEKLELLCQPEWTVENEEKGQTEIGLSFLRSPDSPKLARFIDSIREKNESDDIRSLIIEDDTDFIV